MKRRFCRFRSLNMVLNSMHDLVETFSSLRGRLESSIPMLQGTGAWRWNLTDILILDSMVSILPAVPRTGSRFFVRTNRSQTDANCDQLRMKEPQTQSGAPLVPWRCRPHRSARKLPMCSRSSPGGTTQFMIRPGEIHRIRACYFPKSWRCSQSTR